MDESKNHLEISPEDEIRLLEAKLAIKKRELEERGEIKHEKEVFREVLKEHIETVRPVTGDTASGVKPVISDSALKTAQKIKDDEQESQLEHLLQIALGESLLRAVHIAEALGPYMLDLLHDTLVDKYYDKLVAARRITQ